MLMAEKLNQLPHPQTALNKFMVRILFERDQLVQAYNLDGKTVSIFKVKPHKLTNNLDGKTVSIFKVEPHKLTNNLDGNTYPDIDDINGLVDSHLEDMYHSLYGEAPELPKLIDETKTECCMADANFAGVLIPPLNAMVKVHRSCIEDLRNGKGWNWETHSEAFEELNQLSGVYTYKLNPMTANTIDKPVEIQTPTPLNQIAANPADNPVALQPIAKKKKGRDSGSIKINDFILKNKKLPDKELALMISKKLGLTVTSEMIRSRKSRLRQKGEL
jgi:hypothetical protein